MRTQRLLVCYRNCLNKNRNISHTLAPVRQDLTILCNHILNSFEQDHYKHWGHLIKQTKSHRVITQRESWSRIRQLVGVTRQYTCRLIVNNRSLTDPVEITQPPRPDNRCNHRPF